MVDTTTLMPASVLAFLTTVHVALAALRRHRSGTRGARLLLLVPGVALGATAWLFPTVAWLAAGLAAHFVWFGVCELLPPAQAASRTPQHRSPSAARPTASATPGNARQQPATGIARPAQARPPAGSVARAGTPASPSPAAAALGPARPKSFVQAPVLATLDESRSIRTFRLARPEGFDFQAGQFITVRVQVDGQPHVRCYSISSAPETPGYLEISVRRQGLVSAMLHSTVRPGSLLAVKPPAGSFVYPAGDDRPLVLVAGGVGITPVLSMLRHGAAADPNRPITLLYSVRDEQDIAFRDELSVFVRRHPQVRVAITISGSSRSERYRVGRIDEALVADTVTDPAHSIFLMCGPDPMIDGLRRLLADLGVPAAQVRSELFQPAAAIGAKRAALAAPPPIETDEAPDAASPQGDSEGAAGDREPAGPRLLLARSNRTVAVEGNQTLLEAAESAGAEIPCLCRSGVCGTCRTRLISGDAECTSDALDDEDRAGGFVLPCVTWARGDCSLDA